MMKSNKDCNKLGISKSDSYSKKRKKEITAEDLIDYMHAHDQEMVHSLNKNRDIVIKCNGNAQLKHGIVSF